MSDRSDLAFVRGGALARAIPYVATAALLAWAAALLLTLPAIGVADRGDYYRVAQPAGIAAEEGVAPSRHPALQRTFAEAPAHGWGGTTAVWVARIAKNVGVTPGTFDIRRLGAVYLLLAAALDALALSLGGVPALCFVLTWVFVDPSYVAYFNSLYSEPPALVAVFGTALWLGGRQRESRAAVAALVVILLFGAFSRLPMCGLPCIVLAVLLVERRRAERPPTRGVVAALALTALVPPYFAASPNRYAAINDFHSVFMGAASLSDDPARALEEMGVSREYSGLVGKNYFVARPPKALERELRGVSRIRRAAAYFGDAGIFVRAVDRLGAQLATGATEPDYERPDAPRRDRVFWQFTRLRTTLLGRSSMLAGLALAGMAAWVVAAYRGRIRTAVPPRVIAFLWVLCVTQIVVAIAGDGFFSLGRHLLLARYAFDAGCALLLLEGVLALARRSSEGARVA